MARQKPFVAPDMCVFFADVYFSAFSDFRHCLCFKRILEFLKKGKGAESVLNGERGGGGGGGLTSAAEISLVKVKGKNCSSKI